MLCDVSFAKKNMIIKSTQFQHKHKTTCIPPGQNTVQRTDHVLVNVNEKK
jgi:hypothetical protein